VWEPKSEVAIILSIRRQQVSILVDLEGNKIWNHPTPDFDHLVSPSVSFIVTEWGRKYGLLSAW